MRRSGEVETCASEASVVRVVAEPARQPRVVEHERDADQRDARPERPPRPRARAPTPARRPPGRASRQRRARRTVSASHAESSAPGPPWTTVSADETTTTRSASTSARLTCASEPSPRVTGASSGSAASWTTTLAAERARLLQAGAGARGRAGRASGRARRTTRIVCRSSGMPRADELVEHGGERLPSRVDLRAR